MNNLPSFSTPVRLNRHEFTKPHFNVDKFLVQSRKHVSWEDMKDDLHVYLKILQNSMIELINKDYADFVNLSSSLVGLSPVIDKTKSNLTGVQQEFNGYSAQLRAANQEVASLITRKKEMLLEQSQAERRIKYLRSLRKLHQNVVKSEETMSLNDADAVYRLAGILSAVENLQRQLQASGDSSASAAAHKKVFEIASGRYCEILDGKLCKALQAADTGEIERLLLSYEAVGRRDRAVDVAIQHVFEPKLPRPKRMAKDILMNNLISSVLASLRDSDAILQASQASGSLLLTAMFESLSRFIRSHFGDVTIPVDAQLFHSCFLTVASLSSKLELPEGLQESFDSRQAVKSLTAMFNLSVFHRLLVQETRKAVETAAAEKVMKTKSSKFEENMFTSVVKKEIETAWSDSCFLDDLLHETWELTLQISNFFLNWANDKIAQFEQHGDSPHLKNLTDGEKVQNGIASPSTTDHSFAFQFSILGDLRNYFTWLRNSAESQDGFIRVHLIFTESRTLVTSDLASFEAVVDEVSNRALEQVGDKLKESFGKSMAAVSEIPRQYRWTRKERPAAPSLYLEHAFRVLEQFLTTARPVIREDDLNRVLHHVLERSLEVYATNVKNVLVSVDKVSSSLSKLKKSATRATELSESTDVISDDDKIKMQLKIDIDKLDDELRKYPVEADLKEIRDMLGSNV